MPSPTVRTALPSLLALALVALAWLSTLQTTIGAANEPFLHPSGMVGALMDDSGEFVVAWNTWGVTHPPGYPLLGAAGNVLARAFRLLGANPVQAAALVSWLGSLAALGALAWLVGRAGDRTGLGPATAVLLAGFGLMTWLYASVAEVYGLGLLLGFGALALAWATGERPTTRRALALGLVVGLAAGHHRTLLMLLPALAFAAWPARRLGPVPWVGAAVVALASLGVYAYLPLAALAGSPWVYGRSPATVGGFLDALLAVEYTSQLSPPGSGDWLAALAGRLAFTVEENAAAVLFGLAGLAVALGSPWARRPALVLALAAAAYFVAPVGQYLLVGTHLPVMVAVTALAGTAGLGVATLADTRQALGRPVHRYAGLVAFGCAGLAALAIGWGQRDRVLAYTRDPLGERIVAAVAALPGPVPTVAEVWGPRYFALAYGHLADGRLAHAQLLDVREDLSGLPPPAVLPETIYTTQDLLHLIGPERWAAAMGAPLALTSAGDGLVALRRSPVLPPAPVPAAASRTLAGDIALESAEAHRDDGTLRLTATWRALRRPAADYHVFVKVLDPATGAVLAQADRTSPVYGFRPTSDWRPGEQVRDDYRVELPAGADPEAVSLGLYTVGADGTFTDHLSTTVPVTESARP